MLRYPISSQNIYAGYQVNVNHNGYYLPIMEKLLQTDQYAATSRKRNLFLLFTFTIPENGNYPESAFSETLEAFVLQASRNALAPIYFWVREQRFSHNPHFHLALWLSGYWLRNGAPVYDDLCQRWNTRFGYPASYMGLVGYNSHKGGVFLDADQYDYNEKHSEVVFWFSYLAKVDEKTAPPHCRIFGSSRLPPVIF